jgi:hypothetical protein
MQSQVSHRAFMSRLMTPFGVASLDEEEIDKLQEPHKNLVQWGAWRF